MAPFTISLWFDSHAEDAARFYTSIFKDGKISRVSRYGQEGFEHHGKPEGSVMTVDFEINGQKFVAINGGPHFKFSESTSLVISCQTQAEIDYYWDRLTAEGGQGVQCGWLKDRFGFSWQVVPTIMAEITGGTNPEASRRAMAEMFKQVKFDIEKLKRAYEGKES